MAMQTDVKSYHNSASGVAYAGRTRLRGVLISPVYIRDIQHFIL
jgi:hypothetical protein